MALKFYIVALGIFSNFKEESISHPSVQMEANIIMFSLLCAHVYFEKTNV